LRTSLYDWLPASRRRVLILPIVWTRRRFDDRRSAAAHLLSFYLSHREGNDLPAAFTPGLVDHAIYGKICAGLDAEASGDGT
jgi:hypothetical protein